MDYVTPASVVLAEGTYTIVFPSTVVESVSGDTYNFKNWEDASTSPVRVINLVSNMSILATYQKVAPTQYNLVISVSAGGETAPTVGTYPYQSGSSVQVLALPYQNYRFLRWLLDGSFYSFDNPVFVLMNSDHVLWAEFEYVPPPPPDQSIIMGVVSDYATGQPLEGASVTADGYGMVTGSDGKYLLTVDLGVYTVTIAKQGYQTQTKIVDASQPFTVVIDVPLQPEGAPPIDWGTVALVATGALIVGAVAWQAVGKKHR